MTMTFEEMAADARTRPTYWATRVKLQIARRLLENLKAQGMTQEALAQALDVKPPQISRLLGGQGNPTIDTVVKAALALGYVPQVTFVPLDQPLTPSKAKATTPPAVGAERPAERTLRKPSTATAKAARSRTRAGARALSLAD